MQTDRTESVVDSRLPTHSPMRPLMAATWRSAYQFRRASGTVGMPWCIIDREAMFLRISEAAGLPTCHLPAADQGGLTVKRFQERQPVMVSWGKASRVSAAQSSKSRQLPPTLPSPSLEKVEAAEALVTFYGASIRSVCAPLPRFLYAYARSGSLGPAALLNALARRPTTINHSS